mgnify:CR=1 FL=1
MLGFLFDRDTRYTADDLVTAIERVLGEWGSLSDTQLEELLGRTMLPHGWVNNGAVFSIVFPDLPGLQFELGPRHTDNSSRQLQVVGRGAYLGLIITTGGPARSSWGLTCRDLAVSRATKKAKRLAKLLRSTHGVTDYSHGLDRYR